MQVVWEMLSDKKIWAMLGDVNRTIDEDITRLMFIELFSRLKTLEEENLALRVLLIEEGIIEQEIFRSYKGAVRDFLKIKAEQAARESDFYASTGVSFPEWVNFKLNGEFDRPFEQ
ncbi:hypothetical protein [Desulfoscipio gibsoniae]|nr:hypothetical protein [Desulfoscipio gibsoniae]